MTAKSTRWWFIRHAPLSEEVGRGRLYGRLDLPCDCSDRATFARLAVMLPGEAIWLRSALGRSSQTLEALGRVGASISTTPQVIADLDEQDFGTWQGRSWDELEAQNADDLAAFWQAPATTTPPNGESFAQMAARVGAVIERLTEAHPGADLVCVAHAGTVRAALLHALGLDPGQGLAFAVENLSLTRLDHLSGAGSGSGAADWRVAFINRLAG